MAKVPRRYRPEKWRQHPRCVKLALAWSAAALGERPLPTPKRWGDRQPPPTAGSRCALTLSPLPALGNRRRSRAAGRGLRAAEQFSIVIWSARCPGGLFLGSFGLSTTRRRNFAIWTTGTSFWACYEMDTRLGDDTAGLLRQTRDTSTGIPAASNDQVPRTTTRRRHASTTTDKTTRKFETKVGHITTMIKFSTTTTTRSHLVSFASRNTIQARKPTTKRNPADYP